MKFEYLCKNNSNISFISSIIVTCLPKVYDSYTYVTYNVTLHSGSLVALNTHINIQVLMIQGL